MSKRHFSRMRYHPLGIRETNLFLFWAGMWIRIPPIRIRIQQFGPIRIRIQCGSRSKNHKLKFIRHQKNFFFQFLTKILKIDAEQEDVGANFKNFETFC